MTYKSQTVTVVLLKAEDTVGSILGYKRLTKHCMCLFIYFFLNIGSKITSLRGNSIETKQDYYKKVRNNNNEL